MKQLLKLPIATGGKWQTASGRRQVINRLKQSDNSNAVNALIFQNAEKCFIGANEVQSPTQTANENYK